MGTIVAMMKRFIAIFTGFALAVLAFSGCGSVTHPAAGTWNGGGLVKTTVVLNSDGTGNYTLSLGGGQSIKWTESGNTVNIYKSDVQDTSKASPFATGQLSDDKKTLNLNVTSPPVGLTLHREENQQGQ
ncbi:MAG TPA: hypothetical protein VFW40_09220 [Capsulimonadaceae bacterium]|nr:hypothetical protein [Capsulimonadaceae bacterium]